MVQRGHLREVSAPSWMSSAQAPQWGQNFVPANIIPMHFGQATVCKKAWQYWHWVALESTAAPQDGQLSVPASIRRRLYTKTGGGIPFGQM